MANKVPPSDRTSNQLYDLLNGREEADDLVSDIMRLGMQAIIQKHRRSRIAEEGKQADHLGRDSYERGDEHRGYRNGYYEKVFKTSAGRVPIDVPRVPGLVLAQLGNIRNIMQPESEQSETISFRAAA